VLEIYARRRASAVLLALAARLPAKAHRRQNDQIIDIAINELQINDLVVIYPHETCPVDGVVVEGHGSMDESYLTGEPYRISKAPGSNVLSGAINAEAVLVVRTERLPQDSRYAKIMQVMAEAEQQRPQLRRLGDQLGAIFAPLAIVMALLVWYFTADADRFLAVLVVATPCPLLIAIPITLVSSVSLAARRGIIIKDPTVLERLPTCRTAIFDKTGTLTYGQPELVEILTATAINADNLLQQVASLERYSKHPLAGALLQAAQRRTIALLEAEAVNEIPGVGLCGSVNGQQLQITSRKILTAKHPTIAALLPPVQAGLECIVLVNDDYAATLQFRDQPRAEGHSFIGHLAPRHRFERVLLVSGDRESEVSYLADLLAIKEAYSEQSPEQKLALVRRETAQAPTLFMGDGINDAPALAAATVGLAFGQHSNVTMEAAGAVILENTLTKVDELLHISALMRRVALQSAVGGILLSVIGMGLAAIGLISPVAGALLQEAIDVLAIINALRLTWQRNVGNDLE
jgi:heavy metal translocating P-type ATPase